MPHSYVEQTGASTLPIAGLNYISDTHLKAIGKDSGDASWTALTIASKNLTASPPTVTVTDGGDYDTVRIYRDSGLAALVDFQSGSRITESDLDTAYQQGLFAAQEVIENAPGTGYPATGAAGATGTSISSVSTSKVGINTTVTITLSTGTTSSFVISDGAAGAAGSSVTSPFTSSYESSSPVAVPAVDTDTEVDHSLAVVPKLFSVVLRCTDSGGEHGYAQNDEVQLFINPSSGDNLAVYANSTKVGFRRENDIYVLDKSSASGALAVITPSKWGLIYRAYA